jgi:hypothetical protein
MQKMSTIKWLVLSMMAGFCNVSIAQNFLIPDHLTLQHGGSIGYLNLGLGYDIFKKVDFEIGYGYVPHSKGGVLNIVSAKFAYKPFAVKIKNWAVIHPVNPGFFATYDFGGDFDFRRDRAQYSRGYYWWNEAIRPHLSFSNEISLNPNKALSDSKIKNVTLYSEFNTNELYVVSWFLNRKTTSLGDIFKLGLGLKIHF